MTGGQSIQDGACLISQASIIAEIYCVQDTANYSERSQYTDNIRMNSVDLVCLQRVSLKAVYNVRASSTIE